VWSRHQYRHPITPLTTSRLEAVGMSEGCFYDGIILSLLGLVQNHGKALGLIPIGTALSEGFCTKHTTSALGTSASPTISIDKTVEKSLRLPLPLSYPHPSRDSQSSPTRRPPCLLPSSLAPTPPSSSPMMASRSPYVLVHEFLEYLRHGIGKQLWMDCTERGGKIQKRLRNYKANKELG
jgi:hypothetical protein